MRNQRKGTQVCTRCVMDVSAVDISFDDEGRCNYCTDFIETSADVLLEGAYERSARLNTLLSTIRDRGRSQPYDCIVGISGGVDSSWALVKAVEHGLRPLAVHMDNGWNSELAQHNIASLVKSLNVDLYTYVIDWDEYKQLMSAFFEADVVDIELLYDNAMAGVVYGQAQRYKQPFILGGTNQTTEGMRLPPSWNWFKYDKRNIRAIARSAGVRRFYTFPAFGTVDYMRSTYVHGLRWISFLDYFTYNKAEALASLTNDFAYKPYPYKHYESVFTRFYQGYLLPKKFGIDKRRVHLSTLIVSQQMTREDALKILESPPYPSPEALSSDRDYFLKKMAWTNEFLEEYLSRPPRLHAAYKSEKALWQRLSRILRLMHAVRAHSGGLLQHRSAHIR